MKRFLGALLRIIHLNLIILPLSPICFPAVSSAQNSVTNELLKNANQFFARGEYDSALISYKKFISTGIVSKSANEKDRIARATLQIANIYTLRRAYSSAESWFHKALEMAEDGSTLKAEIYQNLGSLFFLRDNWENAILNYRKACLIYWKVHGKNSARLADLYTSLGAAYSGNGEYHKGRDAFRKADSILDHCGNADPIRRAGLKINTAGVMLRLDATASALTQYRIACKLSQTVSIASASIAISSNEGMAECYSQLGKKDSALICLQNCLDLINEDGKEPDHERSRIFYLMGKILAREKDWTRSIYYFDKAIGLINAGHLIAGLPNGSSSYDPDLLDLYKIFQGRGRSRLRLFRQSVPDITLVALAYDDFLKALKICNNIGNDFGRGSSRMIFQESTKSILEDAVEAGYLLNMKTGKPGFDELFSLADGSRNRILLGDMEENRSLELSGIPDSIRQEIKDIKDEIVFSSRKYLKEGSLPPADWNSRANEMQSRLIDLHQRLDSLRKKCEHSVSVDTRFSKNNRQAGPAELRGKLVRDEAILEYLSGDSAIYIFLVRKDSSIMKKVDLSSSYKKTFQAFLHALKGAESRNFFALSRSLSQSLFTPISSGLDGIHRLIIIPDRELSLFPFETLIRSDGKEGSAGAAMNPSSWQYLVRDFGISYHFSAESWFRDSVRNTMKEPSYRFAGFAPGFRSSSNNPLSLNPLPFSEKEIKEIAGLFRARENEAIIFQDTIATERNFRNKAPASTHLHIATHSHVNEYDPMNSALVFTGTGLPLSRQDKDDGLLHLDEISNLKLNASLVVLSACATGKGKVTKTEGVLALTRGFYLAGASNVVYSLWSIPDRLTYDFMLSFYRSCFSGKSYGEALREVKLKMISRPETSLPYMWAGMVLLGN